MKFKLDENVPVSSSVVLASVGHDVDTVAQEGLGGAPDPDVVAAATAAGRILISLDVGLADIRAYPPGSHAGIVVLRLADQSAAAVTKHSDRVRSHDRGELSAHIAENYPRSLKRGHARSRSMVTTA